MKVLEIKALPSLGINGVFMYLYDTLLLKEDIKQMF